MIPGLRQRSEKARGLGGAEGSPLQGAPINSMREVPKLAGPNKEPK